MTITFDANMTTILVGVVSSAVSVLATWWFSRRHYTQAIPRIPMTETEAEVATSGNIVILFGVIVVGFIALLIVVVVLGSR